MNSPSIDQRISSLTTQLETMKAELDRLNRFSSLYAEAERLGVLIEIKEKVNGPEPVAAKALPVAQPAKKRKDYSNRGAGGDALRILYANDERATTKQEIINEMASPDSRICVSSYDSNNRRLFTTTISKLRLNGWATETPEGLRLTDVGRRVAKKYTETGSLILPPGFDPTAAENTHAVGASS